MAELTINIDDITAALRKNLDGLHARLRRPRRSAASSRSATASPASSGLPDAAVNELLEFEDGTIGLALNLDEESIGAVVLGDVVSDRGGPVGQGHRRHPLGARWATACSAGWSTPSASPSTARARSPTSSTRRMEVQAPGIMGRKPVHEPLQTGIKAIDAMTPIGRGQRELIIGDRKTGKTTVAIDTIINQKGLGVKCVYVAIGQKASTVAQTVATLEQHGAMDYTVVVVAAGVGPGAVQVPRPLRRLRHGPALDGERRARPGRLRRPVQAGRGLPPGVAAAAPPAGPRGVPRRRLLPPQPPARAGRQAVRRERRRLADRPADHRDQGRRHLGLHPDQRDLDHRRPDLPRGRPVQVGHPPGHQRRPVGVPGGRRRPDQGHEDRRGHAQGRPRPVPRAARRSPRSAPSSTPSPRPRSTAATASPSCSSRASTRRCRSRSRSWCSTPAPAATSTTSPVPDVRRFEGELLDWLKARHSDLLDGIRSTGAHRGRGRAQGRAEDLRRRLRPVRASTDEG